MPRKLSQKRPAQGARLVALREAAGFSQAVLAQLIGTNQQRLAYWEKSDRPPSSDFVPKIAKALGVSVEVLLSVELPAAPRRSGPVGKLRKMFEEAARLPRTEQDRIAHVLAALIDQHKRKAG